MKKINFIVLGMLLASGLALTSGSKVIAKAENGNVAINNFKTWKFAAGWETSQVYTNEGVKVTVPGADTKGDSAWQYSAELPANDSRDTFAFDVSDSLTLEILVKMYDASTNTQLSESVNDGGGALEFYFTNSSTNKDFAMLRIWANSGGWTNADHSFEIYNIVNDSTIWTSQKAADYWVKGDAAGNNKFTLVFDKENIVSSYVGGNDSLVTLGNSTFIETAKTAISDASGVYVRVKGSNGFTKNTDVTLCSINGQSLANDGTNFIDDVAPTFNNASVNKTLMINEPYEIPVEANDVLSDVTYKVRIDGVETEGKSFTPTTKGTMNVTLIASDSAGNISEKEFTFDISDGIEKPTIVSLPTIDDLTINPLTYITFDKPVIEDTTGAAKTILKMYDDGDNLIATMEENSDHKFAYYVGGSFVGGTYKLVYEVTNSAGTTISDPINIKIEIKVKDKASFISTDTSNMFAEYVDSGIALSSSDNFKQFNLGTFDLDDEFDIKFIVNSKTINGVNNDTNYVNLILIS